MPLSASGQSAEREVQNAEEKGSVYVALDTERFSNAVENEPIAKESWFCQDIVSTEVQPFCWAHLARGRFSQLLKMAASLTSWSDWSKFIVAEPFFVSCDSPTITLESGQISLRFEVLSVKCQKRTYWISSLTYVLNLKYEYVKSTNPLAARATEGLISVFMDAGSAGVSAIGSPGLDYNQVRAISHQNFSFRIVSQ